MKRAILFTGLVIIFVANILMMYYAPRGISPREGFQNNMGTNNGTNDNGTNNNGTNASPVITGGTNNVMNDNNSMEGFNSYFLENSAGTKDKYAAMGAFDGVKLSTGNGVSGWRYTAPNEHLNGAEFTPTSDDLFMFKNNQCKPECCGASFSCGGGCVCTTPQQRQYIASRGGNRTQPEDSA
jgi:hypothetical protein